MIWLIIIFLAIIVLYLFIIPRMSVKYADKIASPIRNAYIKQTKKMIDEYNIKPEELYGDKFAEIVVKD